MYQGECEVHIYMESVKFIFIWKNEYTITVPSIEQCNQEIVETRPA